MRITGLGILLLMSALAPPLRAETRLRAEIDQLRERIERLQGGSIDRYGEPDSVRAIDRFWELAQAWTREYLDAHPQASAREIEADLAALAKEGDLQPSAVRLSGDAVVVAIDWSFHGTVFILSRPPSRPFAVAWDIRTAAAKSPPDSALADWSRTVPGVHGGPLGGRVLALPPARSGRPRFLTDAIEHAGLGLDVPAQIGVWEWTGTTAVPEFIGAYSTTGSPSAKLQGNRLLVSTREHTRMFYTCGSCEDPQGTWTLRLTPTGVIDLGHTFDEPLQKFVDDLITRVDSQQDASALASPAARSRLAKALAEVRADGPRDDGTLSLGMLDGWKVRKRGSHQIIDLQTDWAHLVLTVGQRAGKPYVVEVEAPDDTP
jgi:hypothetical protein